MQCGIVYKIQNLDNGKVYVGCTFNFGRRMNEHLCDAASGKADTDLYRDMGQSPERFTFQIIECNISPSDLKARESHWISFYDSARNGYNRCVYAANEELDEYQVDEIAKMLSTSTIKFSEIAKIFGVDESTISDINRGKTWYSSNNTYPLRRNTVKRKKLSLDTLKQIHDLLRDPCISFREIANRFGWESEAVVRKINAGTYSIRLYDMNEYPIRFVDSRKGSRS